MLCLREVRFRNVFTASGTLNFFGQGWPHHKAYRMIPGFDFSGSTFIAKTTTLSPRKGNMPLNKKLQPRELLPNCIKVFPFKGVVLNSVGLSGPGAQVLFSAEKWQKRTKPFFISFMAVSETEKQRLEEMELFVFLLEKQLPFFKTHAGLEINVSCPNTEHDPKMLALEARKLLEIFRSRLSIPAILKINALTATASIKEIAASGLCDALSLSNTIPWSQLPDEINWRKIFKTEISPLAQYGGGGLSGWPLLQIVADKVRRLRKSGITMPIIAGGGILCKRDVAVLKNAGADAIAIASVTMLRPWRVKGIINYANQLFGGK